MGRDLILQKSQIIAEYDGREQNVLIVKTINCGTFVCVKDSRIEKEDTVTFKLNEAKII